MEVGTCHDCHVYAYKAKRAEFYELTTDQLSLDEIYQKIFVLKIFFKGMLIYLIKHKILV